MGKASNVTVQLVVDAHFLRQKRGSITHGPFQFQRRTDAIAQEDVVQYGQMVEQLEFLEY